MKRLSLFHVMSLTEKVQDGGVAMRLQVLYKGTCRCGFSGAWSTLDMGYG
jgi:hypothetical protein